MGLKGRASELYTTTAPTAAMYAAATATTAIATALSSAVATAAVVRTATNDFAYRGLQLRSYQRQSEKQSSFHRHAAPHDAPCIFSAWNPSNKQMTEKTRT